MKQLIDLEGIRARDAEVYKRMAPRYIPIHHRDRHALLDEVERLQALLDRAVEDIEYVGGRACDTCAHLLEDGALCRKCERVKNIDNFCVYPNWQWRGFSEREGG